MIEGPSIFLAFTAGFLSFLSPCCLPLVPGYLATVSGSRLPGAVDLRRRTVLLRALTFVGTFSVIFILLGLSATAAGATLRDNQDVLNNVAGVAIIGLGVFLGASLFISRLNMQFLPTGLIERAGSGGGPVVAGAAFAIAWTPCVGPTLGAILGLAATSSGTAQGGVLLAIYSLGLGVPFLLSAVAFERTTSLLSVLKRHHTPIQLGSAVLLIGMGFLVLTGEMFRLNIEAQRLLSELGLDFFYNL